jgi:hypothetical protein
MSTYRRFKTSKSAVTILVIAVALVIWGNLGFAKKPDKPGNGKPGKGCTYEHDLPVIVSFQDDFVNARIRSDGNGEYRDGNPGVTAFLGRRCGQFVLQTNNTAKGKIKEGRSVSLDFSNKVPDSGVDDLPSGFPTEPFFPESVRIVTSRELDLRAMVSGAQEIVPLLIEFCQPLIGDNVWLSFGDVTLGDGWFDPNIDGSSGTPVTVEHIGDNEWTIETPSGSRGCLHSMGEKSSVKYYGDYNMSFKLTIMTLEPQAAPPIFSLRSKLTTMWGNIKADCQ